jgi:uncharacterized protein (DUF433 family)
MERWDDYVDHEAMDRAPRHVCSDRAGLEEDSQGARSPSPREWGPSVGEIVRYDGRWWAVARDASPPEYCTPIRYFPWCGIDLTVDLALGRKEAVDSGEMGTTSLDDMIAAAASERAQGKEEIIIPDGLLTWSDALQRHIRVPASTIWVLACLAHEVDASVRIEDMPNFVRRWLRRAEHHVADVVGADSWDEAVRMLPLHRSIDSLDRWEADGGQDVLESDRFAKDRHDKPIASRLRELPGVDLRQEGEDLVLYYQDMPLLWQNPDRVSGQLCIYGSRLPIGTPLVALAEGASLDEIAQDWPSASPEVVSRLLRWLHDLVDPEASH